MFCDEVESHLFLDQHPLLELARENEVLITAYFLLAHGRVPHDQPLRWIGESPSETAGQVALRWLLDQPGVSPIPTASSHERRRENFEVVDFDLSQAECDEIELLPTDVRTANSPWAPDWNA